MWASISALVRRGCRRGGRYGGDARVRRRRRRRARQLATWNHQEHRRGEENERDQYLTADDLPRYHGKMMIVDGSVLHVYAFNYTKLDIDKLEKLAAASEERRRVR